MATCDLGGSFKVKSNRCGLCAYPTHSPQRTRQICGPPGWKSLAREEQGPQIHAEYLSPHMPTAGICGPPVVLAIGFNSAQVVGGPSGLSWLVRSRRWC